MCFAYFDEILFELCRWEGPVFKFVDDEKVWLHCSLQVCFHKDCEPVSLYIYIYIYSYLFVCLL